MSDKPRPWPNNALAEWRDALECLYIIRKEIRPIGREQMARVELLERVREIEDACNRAIIGLERVGPERLNRKAND